MLRCLYTSDKAHALPYSSKSTVALMQEDNFNEALESRRLFRLFSPPTLRKPLLYPKLGSEAHKSSRHSGMMQLSHLELIYRVQSQF